MPVTTIFRLLPDADALLALEPEELAGVVLEHLLSRKPEDGGLNRYNFSLVGTYSDYPEQRHIEIAQALMEAWVWLEHEGFIAPKPGTQGEWSFITRRGRQAAGRDGVATYRASALLPKQQLHPSIAQKCWATFLRGEYDFSFFGKKTLDYCGPGCQLDHTVQTHDFRIGVALKF